MTGRFFIMVAAFLILAGQGAFAQNLFAVKGKVFDTDTGEPVANANIAVTGTQTGASSGIDGHFELKLPAGKHIISVTSIGFAKREMPLWVVSGQNDPLSIGLKPEKFEIGGIDVYAMRYIADRDTAPNRVPLSLLPAVTRVSAVEMEKQGAVTLVDALKYVPGSWTENRGRKTKQFFSVRGQKYPYPDYSINGVWQKEFEETGYYLSALDIESVEIVRSGNALVKGLSGLTGVVDIRTKRPEKESLSLTTKYGEMNQYLANLQYGNKIKDLTFNVSTSFLGTDGPVDRNGRERIGNFHGTAEWKLNSRVKLMAGSTYIQGLRQLVNIMEPGANNIITRQEEYDPVRTLLSYAKLIYIGNCGSTTELQTNLSHRNAGFSSYNIPQKTTTNYDEKDWEYGFNLLHSRKLSQTNTLRFGGLYNRWVAPEGKRYYVGRRCDVETYSGVVATEQKLGKLFLDAGVRVVGGHIAEWGGFGIEGSATGFQNVAPIEDEPTPFEWQSVLGASYILSSSLSFHYNLAGGTIAPRKGALTGEGVTPENETRLQHDMGFRLETESGGEFSASAFYAGRGNSIDYSGQTVTVDNGLVMELYNNLDRRSYGMELSAKQPVPALRLALFANAMLMKAEKESSGSMVDDTQLPNLIVNGGLYAEQGRFDANLFVNYTGRYVNNRFVNPNWVKQNGDFPLGDFVSADATIGYTLKGKITTRLFAEVKNIPDKKYMTVAGYPEPGRIFSGGIKIVL